MPTATQHINCHAHCFTLDHVPEAFFHELLPQPIIHFLDISKLRHGTTRRNIVQLLTGKGVVRFVKLFAPKIASQLARLHGLLKYAAFPKQEELIETLYKDYAEQYRLVMLTMDMDFMGAGIAYKNFMAQLAELREVKRSPAWKDKLFPFVFADPRRPDITALVKECIKDSEAPFQGIKLYPAMGYFPFDKRLKDVYQYALAYNIPLLTHCIVGDVHQREEYYKLYPKHPVSGQTTTPADSDQDYKKPENFQINFTHPLNYECLLNPALASIAFGEAVDFSNLKICIAHFGGDAEWAMFKDQEAKSSSTYKQVYDHEPLDISQPWLGNKMHRYNWLKIIKALIRKYPNVYADISYTLHNEDIYPMLKSMLKDNTVNQKILYGTDYYVVASETDEPDIITQMKKHLSAEEIHLIAHDNAIRFLTNDINKIV